MATGTDKFLNYNGLVKLIGLIKKRILDAVTVTDVKVNGASVVNNKIAVLTYDTAMSTTSTNPVQNKVADAAIKAAAKTVRQTSQSGNTALPILTTASGSPTSGNKAEVGYDTDLKFTPSSNTLAIGTGTLTATAYSGKATATETALNSTGSGKGADMVKYDSETTYANGSVGAAIKNLQGAVGGGDLVKSVDNATQDSGNYNEDNIIPNHPRTGNYTKANDVSGTFTYYETRYGLAMASDGIFAGLNGLMSASDKEKLVNLSATGAGKGANLVKYDSTVTATAGSVAEAIKNLQGALDNLNSSTVLLSSNITIDSTSTGNVQDALSALNKLAEANKSAISTLQSGGLTREVVTALPTGSNIKANVIYMILASNDTLNSGDPSTSATTTPYGTNNNSYNEYMYINNAWERIGSTEVNLDIDPITDDEIDTAWTTTVVAA